VIPGWIASGSHHNFRDRATRGKKWHEKKAQLQTFAETKTAYAPNNKCSIEQKQLFPVKQTTIFCNN